MTQTIEIEAIKRLRLEPGDHLLVTLPADTTLEHIQAASELFDRAWPGVPLVIVAGEPIDLQVVSA